MAKQTEFQRQLSDPRWQKKRLEIMKRDKWTCQACGDTEATLTVHHKSYRYENGAFADVWDYEGQDLITLCDVCHAEEEEMLLNLQKTVFFSLRECFTDALEIMDFMCRFSRMKKDNGRINSRDYIIIHKEKTTKDEFNELVESLGKRLGVEDGR